MLDEPERYIEPFARAGSSLISIHIEPAYNHRSTLTRIPDLGCQNGIVLNPDTPAAAVEHLLPQVDLVLAMTVQPGFGGQSFRRDVLAKIGQLAAWRQERKLKFRLEVDGGVRSRDRRRVPALPAPTFVAGTAFFTAPDRAGFACRLRQTLGIAGFGITTRTELMVSAARQTAPTDKFLIPPA